MADATPRPSLLPFSWLTLALWLVAGGVGGLVVRWIGQHTQGVPVPRGTWLIVLAPTIIAIAVAWNSRRKIQKEQRILDPGHALRVLAFARASMVTGAFFAGLFGMIALTDISRWATPMGRERILSAGAAALISLVWCGAGRAGESFLRIPPVDDDDSLSN